MKNIFQILITLLILFTLTNCGLKGPLYFPSKRQDQNIII